MKGLWTMLCRLFSDRGPAVPLCRDCGHAEARHAIQPGGLCLDCACDGWRPCLGKPVKIMAGRQAPADWDAYHHKDCGTQYRGCHPSKCPKNQYEQTGIWRYRW